MLGRFAGLSRPLASVSSRCVSLHRAAEANFRPVRAVEDRCGSLSRMSIPSNGNFMTMKARGFQHTVPLFRVYDPDSEDEEITEGQDPVQSSLLKTVKQFLPRGGEAWIDDNGDIRMRVVVRKEVVPKPIAILIKHHNLLGTKRTWEAVTAEIQKILFPQVPETAAITRSQLMELCFVPHMVKNLNEQARFNFLFDEFRVDKNTGERAPSALESEPENVVHRLLFPLFCSDDWDVLPPDWGFPFLLALEHYMVTTEMGRSLFSWNERPSTEQLYYLEGAIQKVLLEQHPDKLSVDWEDHLYLRRMPQMRRQK